MSQLLSSSGSQAYEKEQPRIEEGTCTACGYVCLDQTSKKPPPFTANTSCGHLSTCQRKECESEYFGDRGDRVLTRLGVKGSVTRRCRVYDHEREAVCGKELNKAKRLDSSAVQKILETRRVEREEREKKEAFMEGFVSSLKEFAEEQGGFTLWGG